MPRRVVLESELMYGLFHVNIKTGEAVRFSAKEVLSRAVVEQRALDCRTGKGRGSYCHDGWSIEARPVEGERCIC